MQTSTETAGETSATAGRPVAIVHDYLTQRGGAERVVLAMLDALPGATLHTSVYDPAGTFPAFAAHDVRTTGLNRIGAVRRHHRLGLPAYAWAFGHLAVEADLVLCSSSGWAHGVQTSGRKVVYCYAPARWLYQGDRYLRGAAWPVRAGAAGVRPWLRRWDHRAAASADAYLTSSTAVRDQLREVYGIDPEVLPPPHAVDVAGPGTPVDGVEPGAFLCVSRLLPYKNVDVLVEAFRRQPREQLVVVGVGPSGDALRASAPANVRFLGAVDDAELRWLYRRCRAVLAVAHEDFGLTPIEGAAFGRPSIALRAGGYLDTVVHGETGLLVDAPHPDHVVRAIDMLRRWQPDEQRLVAQAARFGPDAFGARLRELVG